MDSKTLLCIMTVLTVIFASLSILLVYKVSQCPCCVLKSNCPQWASWIDDEIEYWGKGVERDYSQRRGFFE